jgi:glycosyltransferase involved in cell wall biosynthesis
MTSIGVVIPSRDRASLLRRALASLRGAEQVIVVDDASPTYSPGFANELQANGVEYLRLETQRGPCVARNHGIGRLRTELAFFLDDDDYLLEGGLERIRAVADAHAGHLLYLHNCRFSDGETSLQPSPSSRHISFEEWVRVLASSPRTEFKPAVRTSVFASDRFDDTGAGGEGLLWARLIRRAGAVLSYEPVVFYDTQPGRSRLTSPTELLARAEANARVARAWLDEIGVPMRSIDKRAWERLVISAALYSALAGDPAVIAPGTSARTSLVLSLIRRTPRPLLASGFRLLKGNAL